MPRRRGERWQADVVVGGRRVRRTFRTRQEAEAFEKSPDGELHTLSGLLEVVYRRRWRGTKNEGNAYRNACQIVGLLGSSRSPSEIVEADIDRAVDELDRLGNSPGTINRKLASLSVLLRHGYRLGVVQRVPVLDRRREPRGRLRWLTKTEAAALIAAFDDPVARDLTAFLLATGARLGEALRLEFADIHDRVATFPVTKSGRPRSVPLTDGVSEMIALRRQSSLRSAVFPVAARSYARMFGDAAKAAGLSGVTPHTCRHTTASWLVQAGVPLATIKELLGHSSISTTMRYAHLAPSSLEAAKSVLEEALPCL